MDWHALVTFIDLGVLKDSETPTTDLSNFAAQFWHTDVSGRFLTTTHLIILSALELDFRVVRATRFECS
jgi:hypothetical protein